MQNVPKYLHGFMSFLLFFLFSHTVAQGAVGQQPKVFDLLENGIISCQQGDFKKGIQFFNSALKIDPENYFACINRGIAYKDNHQYEKAIADFNQCLQLDLNNPEAYFQLGNVSANQGHYNEAVMFYSRAIAVDPKLIKAYGARAIVNSMKGDIDAAVDDVNDAISIQPEFPMLYIIRGQILDLKGDCRAALSDFEKAMRYDPENFNANTNIAWILATCPEKKYRNGARAYKLIAKELESNETHENFKILAAAHAEMGDFKAAVLYQERAIEIIRQITPAHKSEEINLQKDLKIYKEQLKSYRNSIPWHLRPMAEPPSKTP